MPNFLARTADSKLHQVVHERLQTDVIREDGLCRLTHASVARRGMCRGRVQFREQETSLRAAGITDNESREREAVLDEILLETLLAFDT
jgi:hypothetical protein